MANITIPNVNFVPEIWAQKALQVLRANVVVAKLCYRDGDVAAFTQGATLHVPVVGTFVANTKAAGGNVTLQVPTDSRIDVTLNQHKEATFLIEDILKVQANQDLMTRYVTNAVAPLAEGLESYLLGLWASFTTAALGASATPITAATLRSTRKQFNDNKVQKAGRALIVSDGDEMSILGDAGLASYFAFAKPGAITEGPIGRVYGIDVYQSQLIPFSVNNKNLAMAPDAIILAMRGMPDSGAPGVDQTVVSDPDSGLTLRQTVSYNPNALGLQITLDMLYGASVLRNASGFVVQS